MINDKDRELIHSGVDGELDESGKEQLRQLLESSQEARHFHSELSRLAEFLDKIPDHELPDGLHARIVEETPLPSVSPLRSIFSFSELPGTLRYGFAAAAALVLVLFIVDNQQQWSDPGDVSNMVGTIASAGPVTGNEVLDKFEFESGTASAEVSLGRRDGTLVLDLRLNSETPVGYRVDLSGSGLKVSALAQLPGSLEYLATDNQQELSGQSNGKQQFLILLEDPGVSARAEDVRIEVRFDLGDGEIDGGALVLEG
jgi:hypothetical protein